MPMAFRFMMAMQAQEFLLDFCLSDAHEEVSLLSRLRRSSNGYSFDRRIGRRSI